MTAYRVVFTETARSHVDAIDDWWAANRPAAPYLFQEELGAAVLLVSGSPMLGTEYRKARAPGARRIVIGRTRFHLYWEVDSVARTVTITAVWHSGRGSGPPI